MLDFTLWFLQIAGMAGAYSAVGGLSWKLVGELITKRRSDGSWSGDHPLPVFSGAFWPIALPLEFPFLLFALGKRAKAGRISLPLIGKNAEQKVLDYAASPILVLSKIIAQRIIAEPENLRLLDTYYPEWEWTSSDKRIKVKVMCENRMPERVRSLERATLDGKHIECEELPIINAMKQAATFKIKKDAADKEAARQLKALTAVESLLLPEKN